MSNHTRRHFLRLTALAPVAAFVGSFIPKRLLATPVDPVHAHFLNADKTQYENIKKLLKYNAETLLVLFLFEPATEYTRMKAHRILTEMATHIVPPSHIKVNLDFIEHNLVGSFVVRDPTNTMHKDVISFCVRPVGV